MKSGATTGKLVTGGITLQRSSHGILYSTMRYLINEHITACAKSIQHGFTMNRKGAFEDRTCT